ncbi:ankyrin repeat domain-containing protein [Pseudomonas indica]|uniref:ankyrin repeat domain-containing protein n=1 Tax=Pseudomonas indica TaxID=137658 RepID=UPI003FD1EE8A
MNATSKKQQLLLLAEYSTLPEYSGIECVDAESRSLLGDSPIHIAATRGNVNEIEILLKCGANINSKGEHGYTALHDAIEQGHKEAAIYLLKHGANPEILNDDGF